MSHSWEMSHLEVNILEITELGATRKVLEPMYSHHTLYSSQLEHYPFLRNHCQLLPSSLSPPPPPPRKLLDGSKHYGHFCIHSGVE